MVKSKEMLVTMDEICAYSGRHRDVIKTWVKTKNFPATIVDGRWQSSTVLIDNWNRRYIERAGAVGG